MRVKSKGSKGTTKMKRKRSHLTGVNDDDSSFGFGTEVAIQSRSKGGSIFPSSS